MTPDGSFAAFISLVPADRLQQPPATTEIYRYDADSDALDCASCPPTERAPRPPTRHSPRRPQPRRRRPGLLHLRRAARRCATPTSSKDAYEWDERRGRADLDRHQPVRLRPALGQRRRQRRLSSSPATTLVPQDKNGTSMKIYDAREDGGFLFDPARRSRARPPTSATARARKPPRRRQHRTPPAPGGNRPRQRPRNARSGFVKKQRQVREDARSARGHAKRAATWLRAMRSKRDDDDEQDASRSRSRRLIALALLAAGLAPAPAEAIELLRSAQLDHPGRRPPRPRRRRSRSTNPGAPEAAKNVIFNAPQGVFGNPNAITSCTVGDFALDAVPAGLAGRA